MASILEDLESIKRLAEEIMPEVTKRDLANDIWELGKMHNRYIGLVKELGFIPANRKMEVEFPEKWDCHKEQIWQTYDNSERGDL
jgi:hypothetical protein|tara:strand:+ start:43 stop:297 length:255 start_codon:yes stop_codon:yes gene_type:complete